MMQPLQEGRGGTVRVGSHTVGIINPISGELTIDPQLADLGDRGEDPLLNPQHPLNEIGRLIEEGKEEKAHRLLVARRRVGF